MVCKQVILKANVFPSYNQLKPTFLYLKQVLNPTPPLVLSTEHWFRQEPLQPLVQWLEQTLEHADYRYQRHFYTHADSQLLI